MGCLPQNFEADPDCAVRRTVPKPGFAAKLGHSMATKEDRQQAKCVIEELEMRVHAGPPVNPTEILSAREFLRQREFSPASDYYDRLVRLQDRLKGRTYAPAAPVGKRNYGGKAGGCWMQLQSAYDHVILSRCHAGEFNSRRGRIKISHRFNQQGRIDFVELKFLNSLQPCLNGSLRKLITVKNFQGIQKDWSASEAFVLEVLPQELVFLFEDIFRCPKGEVFAWLINTGHGLVDSVLKDLRRNSFNGGNVRPEAGADQLPLQDLRTDEVALPILQKAALLQSAVDESGDPKSVVVRYVRT
jgi:hypothetical protein